MVSDNIVFGCTNLCPDERSEPVQGKKLKHTPSATPLLTKQKVYYPPDQCPTDDSTVTSPEAETFGLQKSVWSKFPN